MAPFSFGWMSKEFMHGYGYGISSMNTNYKEILLVLGHLYSNIQIFKYLSFDGDTM